jgi:hypothetical protein
MPNYIVRTLLVVPLMFAGLALAPAGAAVCFIASANGDVVSIPVTVKFGLNGIGVAPAGVDNPKTGHRHLLIDGSKLPPTQESGSGCVDSRGCEP